MAPMGPMPPPPGRPAPPRGLDALFERLRGLPVCRDTEHKWGGGVCSGMAARFGVDPLVVRAGFLALTIFGGAGPLFYLVALALLPDLDGRIWAEEAVRHGDRRGIFLLVVVALGLSDELRNRWWLWLAVPAALGAWWYFRQGRGGKAGVAGGWSAGPDAHPDATAVRPGWSGPPSTDPGATSRPDATDDPAYPLTTGTSTSAPSTAAAGWGAPERSTAPPEGIPYGMGPGRTYAGVRPPRAPIVVRARRPSGGFAGFLIVLGLAVVAFGAGWSAAREGWVRAADVSFGLTCAVGVIGVALVAKGLRGQRAPFIGPLAVLVALGALGTAVVPQGLSRYGTTIGDRSWAPTAGTADPDYRLGIGDAQLDLGGLTAATADHQKVSASVGIGELVILVPNGLTVLVDASVGVGDIEQRASATSRDARMTDAEGAALHEVMQFGTGEPDVLVTTQVGLGSVIIVRPAGTPTTVPTPAPTTVPSAPATPSLAVSPSGPASGSASTTPTTGGPR